MNEVKNLKFEGVKVPPRCSPKTSRSFVTIVPQDDKEKVNMMIRNGKQNHVTGVILNEVKNLKFEGVKVPPRCSPKTSRSFVTIVPQDDKEKVNMMIRNGKQNHVTGVILNEVKNLSFVFEWSWKEGVFTSLINNPLFIMALILYPLRKINIY